MNFITSINSVQLNDLIQSASERVILALPGLFKENIKVISSRYEAGFKNIKVIVNCSEKIIRQGYGEIEAIQKLKELGVPLYDQPENLVSFIISDNKGYFLFPQSRIFLEDSHKVRNAIEMDPYSLEQIIGLFFPPNQAEKKQFEDKLTNALILSSHRINNIDDILEESSDIKVSLLDDVKFNPVKKAIEANPPIHPDLKRELDFYTTNFLWINLKFKGANISNKTITIPKHVLPIDSEDLRKKLNSNIKLFENIENSTWYFKLKKINDEEKKLRKTYLNPVKEKNGMNIISKTDFSSFLKEFISIQQNIAKTTTEVKQKINEEIVNTKTRFQQVLRDYYKKNPTDELKTATPAFKKEILESLIEYKIHSIGFPVADDLLSNFSLSYQDYELTSKDLENEKLLTELRDKNILNDSKVKSVGKLSKGFQSTLWG